MMTDARTLAYINMYAVLGAIENLCELDTEASNLVKTKKPVSIGLDVTGGPSATLTFKNGRCRMEQGIENCDVLYDTLKKGILSEIPDVKINGAEKYASKFVLNVSFIGLKAEVLLHTLENYNIFVSTGSACSSHKPDPSHVLTAMGLSREETGGAVRFSFSGENTIEDIEQTIQILIKEVAVLRRYTRNR